MNFRDRPYLDSVTIPGHKKHREKVTKIKVPFHCMFSESNGDGRRKTEKKLGAVHRDCKCQGIATYVLVDMSKQKSLEEDNVVAKDINITKMIKEYGINIGKAEIIFWED